MPDLAIEKTPATGPIDIDRPIDQACKAVLRRKHEFAGLIGPASTGILQIPNALQALHESVQAIDESVYALDESLARAVLLLSHEWIRLNPGADPNDTSGRTEESYGLEDAITAVLETKSLDGLISVARSCLVPDIAQRLDELRKLPYEVERGEQPLNAESVRLFLYYCLKRKQMQRPVMTVTPDGILQADWRPDRNHLLSIRFMTNGIIQIAIRQPALKGAWTSDVDDFLEGRTEIAVPRWA